MRTIKFRAWYEDEQRMIFFGLHDSDCGFDVRELVSVDDFPTMEFIGLADKFGKDIFEGDIVKYGDTYGTVRWDIDNARFYVSAPAQNTEFNSAIWNLHMRWEAMEIIGNIYEKQCDHEYTTVNKESNYE